MLRKWIHTGGFPPGRPSEYDLAAYGACQVAMEAIRRAGENLTRESFVNALETIENFETGVIFPVTYGPNKHEATDQVLIVQVNQNLHWVPHPNAK
jgi:ABC-type branched-subunit amino acid transport system substrate-binding protein